jgi:predicted Ser/Thr protein kinase
VATGADGFRAETQLKGDALGRIEQGRLADAPADAKTGAQAAQQAIRRDVSGTRLAVRPFACWLLRNEARALAAAERAGVAGVPRLLAVERQRLLRTWLDGRPMQQARPTDPQYFRAARRLLVALHCAGVTHNDTAKEPNWLVLADGSPALVDFQLARLASRRGASRPRGRLFRLLGREDLRHLCKHKRSYCPAELTARERRLLARPSTGARLLRAGPKRLYNLITRGLLGWEDDEGRGGPGERTAP